MAASRRYAAIGVWHFRNTPEYFRPEAEMEAGVQTREGPSFISPIMPVFDTIIIGAGWSGAVAAKHLASKGYSVLVLEARDRVGGRARTWTNGAGLKVDVGCSWIHGYNEGNPARSLAEQEGVVS